MTTVRVISISCQHKECGIFGMLDDPKNSDELDYWLDWYRSKGCIPTVESSVIGIDRGEIER